MGAVGALTLVFVIWLNNRPADDVVIPTPPMPAVNGYDDVKRACDMLKGRTHLFPASMPNYSPATDTLRDYEAAYAEARPALDVLHAALAKPYQNPPPRIPDMGFEGYARLREVARTLSGAADYKARLGRYGEAVDHLLDGLELGTIMPRGGALVADLVGVAVQAISIRHPEEYLPRLSSRELSQVASRLEQLARRRQAYTDIVSGEGYTSVTILKDALAGVRVAQPGKYYSSVRMLAEVPDDRGPTAAEVLKMARLALRSKSAVVREALAYYRAASREVSGPYTGHSSVPAPDVPFMSGIPELIVQAWKKHIAMVEAQDVLRVEVALLRYRADNRRYPDRLAALSPHYLPSVPDDVCAGRRGTPLRYHATAGGASFFLYSVGPNMADDGGRYERDPSKGGDIVAGHLNGR